MAKAPKKEKEVKEPKVKDEPETKKLKPLTAEVFYVFFSVKFLFFSPVLGTNSNASIHLEHILRTVQKMLAKAAELGVKATKIYQKYVGVTITEEKERAEIKGIIKKYEEWTGTAKSKIPEIPAYHCASRLELRSCYGRRQVYSSYSLAQ